MAPALGPRSRVAVVSAAVYAVWLVVLAATASALTQGERLGVGRFVDDVGHDVIRLRVLGRFTIFADESLGDVGADLLTSFMFMAGTGVSLLALALTARAAPGDRRLHLLFAVAAAGTTFLAFDEQFELIDSLGYNLSFLYVPDVVFYTPFVIAAFVVFKDLVLRIRSATYVMLLGGAIYLAAELMDQLSHDRLEGVEERLEVLCSAIFAIALGALAFGHLARLGLGPGRPSADEQG